MSMLSRLVGTMMFASALTGAADPASACIFIPTAYHRIDAELRALDTSAPGRPVVVEVNTFRRHGMTCTLASCVANSCGNTGTVRIDLAPAADDGTPAPQLGYRLRLVSGELPESMQDLIGVNLAGDRPLLLRPTFDEVPSLDVTLDAVAIDAAGNESAPSEPFVVQFDGCTLASVGEECEDELEADADLSKVFGDDGDEDLLPGAGSEHGASCALPVGKASGSALLSVALGLGLLALRSARLIRQRPRVE